MSLNIFCESRNMSSAVAAVAPMPSLFDLTLTFREVVAPCWCLPRPWPFSHPMPDMRRIPLLSFSSSQKVSPARERDAMLMIKLVCRCADQRL